MHKRSSYLVIISQGLFLKGLGRFLFEVDYQFKICQKVCQENNRYIQEIERYFEVYRVEIMYRIKLKL